MLNLGNQNENALLDLKRAILYKNTMAYYFLRQYYDTSQETEETKYHLEEIDFLFCYANELYELAVDKTLIMSDQMKVCIQTMKLRCQIKLRTMNFMCRMKKFRNYLRA
ncbi:hypothetical protein BIY23_01555 [Wolbachia pipientis]|uniref:Uncharacterized protein n=1 Tax=Wolbachia pipientis TaxID=955 RepID=A0A1E7QLC8_WOLPI|nr:hypothetical protein BIY23_01555 [Wolbachia pipientis]